MNDADQQARVLAALRQLEEEHAERRAFAAEEVATAAGMGAADVETLLDELVNAGRVDIVTAQWPDQGGRELPPGGRLYNLVDVGRGDL